ncbi:MAG: WecB/TagA/CpsF family glycosyltransferase [Bacteroidia bacterium]|nr:WecB/TagA/CpsF family glycosyltransferase [Bacteroidia bacterium]
MKTAMVRILNIDIHNYTFEEFLSGLKSGVVFTPNVDHIMKLQKDREFYDVYTRADYRVCDSQIVKATSGLVSSVKIQEQIAGSDFFPAFCQYHRNNTAQIRVFLLGGTEESVIQAKDQINRNAGSPVVIDGYSPPFGFERNEAEEQKIINRINQSGATVLAVGVGAPKQEKWIMKHKHKMPGVKIFFAIGATIDFQAGNIKRSPKWITAIGMEWLYRMLQEPQRMVKRYLIDDLPYFYLILKQRLGKYQNPWA